MSLVPSLLQAIVRVDGEALVMHAGDKPYVVSPTGQVDLASRGLTLDAVNGIVAQLLPMELQNALEEFGAVQHELAQMPEFPGEHFTIVAARGGDDIWAEIRRRRIPEDDRVPDELFAPSHAVTPPADAVVPSHVARSDAAPSHVAPPSLAQTHLAPSSAIADDNDELPVEMLGFDSPRANDPVAIAVRADASPEYEVEEVIDLDDDLMLPQASDLWADRPEPSAVDPVSATAPVAAVSTEVEAEYEIDIDIEPEPAPAPSQIAAQVRTSSLAPVFAPALTAVAPPQQAPIAPTAEPPSFAAPIAESIEPPAFAAPIAEAIERTPFDPPIAASTEPRAFVPPITASAEPEWFAPPVTVSFEPPPIAESSEPPAFAVPIAASDEPSAFAGPIAESVEPPSFAAPIVESIEPRSIAAPIAASVEPAAFAPPIAASIAASVEPPSLAAPIAESIEPPSIAVPIAESVEPPAFAPPIAASAEPPAFPRPVAESVERPPFEPPIAASDEPPSFATRIAASDEPPAFAEPIAESIESPAFAAPIAESTESPAFAAPIAESIEPPAFAPPIAESVEPPPFAAPIAESTERQAFATQVSASAESPSIALPIAAAAEPTPFAAPVEPLFFAAPTAARVEPPPAPVASVEPPQPAVVLNIARNPIRSELPPPPFGDSTLSGLERLLRVSSARGASTLYLSSQSRPCIRVDGELQMLDGEPVHVARDVESLLLTLMPERNHEALRTGAATEWICDLEGVGRVRCMSFRDQRGPGGVFRLMPTRSASADQLGLPKQIQALTIEPEGLVLVAGPRSSGKRTTISAFVDLMNRTRHDHIITIEREINIQHERIHSFISQREVRGSDEDLLAAARAAIREDPDVLVIEDIRTGALMNVALEAAAAGRLVVGGFTAHTATGAVDRIIDLYAPEYHRQVQMALADTLCGVIAQVLLRKIGGGRLPARELLLNTPAVSGAIAEGKTSQLPMAIEGGRRYGMMPLNDTLVGLVQNGSVEAREAYRHSPDRPGFLAALNRQGIDTTFVERLANG